MKKKHKRILALILAFAMAFSSLIYVSATDGEVYEISEVDLATSDSAVETEGETITEDTRAESYTWQLGTGNGCEAVNGLQGGTTTLYSDYGTYGTLIVDATSGKFHNDRGDQWAQVNDGTIIYVPAAVGSVLSFTSYNAGTATTDGGNSFSGGTDYTVTSADLTEVDGVNYAALTFSGVSYVSVITEDNTNATEDSGDTSGDDSGEEEEEVRAESYTWYLGESNGCESVNQLQGAAATLYSELGTYGTIIVDATSGKFHNSGRGDSWAQVNDGTVIYVPAAVGSVLTYSSYGAGTATTGAGNTIACASNSTSDSYTVISGDLTEIDGINYVALTFAGVSYLSAITEDNTGVVEDVEPIGEAENFTLWLDDYANGASSFEQVTLSYADSTLSLFGNTSTEYSDGLDRFVVKWTVDRADRTGVGAWKAGNRNANANDITEIPTFGDGTAVVFTPAATGTFNTYLYTTSFLRVWDFNTEDGSRNGYVDSDTNAESYAFTAVAGHTYVLSTTGKTNNCGFCGFEYIIDEDATVSLNWTEETAGAYDNVKVTFTDAALGTTAATVAFGASSVKLLNGHTYTLSTDDGGAAALVGGAESFTVDGSEVTIDMTDVPDVSLSGNFLYPDGSVVTDASFVESITFTNMNNGTVYTAEVNADGTYTCTLKPGNYNTTVSAGTYVTYDRAEAVAGVDNTNDVYLETLGDNTYNLDEEIQSSTTLLEFDGFKYHSTQYGVAGGVGALIFVPVTANQTVTAKGSYDGEFTIIGNGEGADAVVSEGDGSAFSATYTTADDDTFVAITVTATGNYASGSGSCYIKSVAVETIPEEVEFTSEITVGEGGDYTSLNDAVAAVNAMTRPDGEEGRVYITLTSDLQEQVVVDADYITLLGDGHEINWYYGQTCSYYSVDSNGYYSDRLFYDKYEKTEASGNLWGGVVIIMADMFRAEDTIFRNTFNYYVTEKEVEDGAYQTQGSLGLRQLDSDVSKYSYKERSNAFYLGDPNNSVKDIYVELYNCQVLSSQDTFGRNGSTDNNIKFYAKNCVIGGNVDYICGEFTALFDECELQWMTYADDASNNAKIGYITAAKTNPYIFRNCEVTLNDDSVGTVVGCYGRTWGSGSTVYFVNTETNGHINTTTGWGEMSTGDGDTANFYEYNNTNNGEVFYTAASFDSSYVTEITDETVINNLTTDDIITAYLSNWTPYYYDAETAEDDTTEATTETVTETETASETTTETTTESSGGSEEETLEESYEWDLGTSGGGEAVKIEGTTGTISAGTSGTIIVDATAEGAKYDTSTRTDEWAQVNAGTVLYVPAAVGSVISYVSYQSASIASVGSTAVASGEEYTVTEDDLVEIDGVTYVALTVNTDGYISAVTEDNSNIVEAEDTGNGLRGDIDQNGVLTANDAACLLLYVQGGYEQNAEWNVSKYIADVAIEGDTEITAADAALILAKVLNPSVEFKAVEGESSGDDESTTEATTEETSETTTETTTEGSGSGGDSGDEETIVGSSFTWWFDEVNNGGSVAVGDYNAGADDEGNYAALITLIPCLSSESYTSWAKSTSYSYEYTDGVTHYGYKMGTRPSSWGTLPTTGNAVVYTANSSGMLTVYAYIPASKNLALYDYGVGGTSSGTSLVTSSAPDTAQNMSFTVSVEAGHVYAFGPSGTNGVYIYGVKYLINEPVETALSFTKSNADEFVIDTDTVSIYFTDVDSAEVITAATTDTSVTLNMGHTYSVSTSDGGVDAAFSTGAETITSDGSALEIILTQLPEETLTGEITGSATDASVVSSISFTKMDDESIVYTFDASAVDTTAGTYSVSLYPGEYNTSVVTTDGSFTNDRVSVAAGETNENEIYLEYEEKELDPISFVSEISVGEGGDYATFKEALAAIGAMSDRPEGEDGRVTINLLSDIQEQVYMNQNYVTLKGNGNEVNWYYGDTGGTTYYYSIDPATGLYSESLFRDKYSYTQPAGSFWGGVMIVVGDYFKAENAVFKNTYNYYVPDKEMEDLAGGDKGLKRLAGDDVRTSGMRERGTALAMSGNYSEYYQCEIYSSQDALGWNGSLSNYTYFQDCVISGNTDYICGAGTLVFDNCELRWFTEKNMNGLGYITAPRSMPYIFRNCEITEDGYVTPSSNYGTYGRPWGGTSATCYYVQCETNGLISSAGWSSMGSTSPENAQFYEYQNTSNGAAFETKLGKQVTDAQTINDLTTDDIITVYLNGWTPTYYVSVGEGEGTVETTEAPTEATTSYECDLSYGDDFTGFLKSNADGTDVNLAYSDASGVSGNTSAMIQVEGKAVALPLEAPITSGKVTVTADFLRTDTGSAGRTFRIYFENEAAEASSTDSTVATVNYDNVKDTIVYHLMDVASTVYVNASNVSANSADGTSLGATLEDGVWYRIEITADLDKGTSTTAIYKHGSDGTYTTDDTQLVLVGSETSSDLLTASNGTGAFVQQIRFVKTASATSYWDNITVKTEASAE